MKSWFDSNVVIALSAMLEGKLKMLRVNVSIYEQQRAVVVI